MIDAESLTQLGLHEKEASIYLAALALGPAPITKIAPKAGVKRSTVYEVMPQLLQKRLISVTAQGKRTYYVAAEPDQLQCQLDRQRSLLATMLPDLRALSQTATSGPTVQMYEGTQGLRSLYEDTLVVNKPVVAFFGVNEIVPELYEYLRGEYLEQRLRQRLWGRVIAPDNEPGREYKKRDMKDLHETRLIDGKKYPFSIEINVYGNKTSFISFAKDELFGAILTSPQIAKTMRSVFEYFWDHAEKKARRKVDFVPTESTENID